MQCIISHIVWLSLIVYWFIYIPEKITCVFHPLKKTQFGHALFDPLCLPLYFTCQKSSHRFLPIFFLSYFGYCSHWNYQTKKHRLPYSFHWKKAFTFLSSSLAVGDISHVMYMYVHALDDHALICVFLTRKSCACSRDEQCYIEERHVKQFLAFEVCARNQVGDMPFQCQ